MSTAEYVTKDDLQGALKGLGKEFESRLYTVKGDFIGKIEASEDRMGARMDASMSTYEQRTNIHMNTTVAAAEERIMARMTACMGSFEKRILEEIRNRK